MSLAQTKPASLESEMRLLGGAAKRAAGALALVSRPLQRAAGFALAAYAICVWPANFKHAIDGIDLPYISSSWLYHGPRLAFQPVLVWWALFCAGIIDWPSSPRS